MGVGLEQEVVRWNDKNAHTDIYVFSYLSILLLRLASLVSILSN